MRVYEFGKQHGIPNKELLAALQNAGFEVHSHMVVLTQEQIDHLNKKFKLIPVQEEKKAVKVEAQESKSEPKPVKQTKEPAVVSTQSTISEKKQKIEPMVSPKVMQPEPKINVKPEEKRLPQEKVVQEVPQEPTVEGIVLEPLIVGDAAIKLGKAATEVIMTLLKWGIVANKNQMLSREIIARLAEHYQIKVIKAPEKIEKEEEAGKQKVVSQGNQSERLPVVVVIGHVDHGKTSLLDFIRKTRVAMKEKGGITQHLGAYEVRTPQGGVVFLDTPGHEAFSKIRMRGIKVADIAVLVVAADDSVMPQTVEAIKFAKTMEVPVIVAANKIDKVDISRLDVVKRDLAQHDLLPEDWGGPTVIVPLSAKTGQGIDQLLEMLVLQAQMMELTADLTVSPCGYVLESRLEKGRGPVATIITKHGVLKVGDYFIAGKTSGHITSLVDSHGKRVSQVAPSIPVQVAGFADLPEAGDYFEVVTEEEFRKARADKNRLKPVMRAFTADSSINVMIKADTNSSKEAIVGAIEKLSKGLEKGFRIVSASVGDITESDIDLAASTNSMILGFTIKAEPNAIALAHKNGVKIHHYSIIYQMLDALTEMAENAKEVKIISTKIGEAEVRKIFDIKELGVIAGSYIKDGRFSKEGRVIILRGPRKVGEGKIKSLQRDKKSVKEVHTGFECAFLIDGFNEWEIGDRVECYLDTPEARITK